MIVPPAMPAEQTASRGACWTCTSGCRWAWTLIGGKLPHLYCAERGQFPCADERRRHGDRRTGPRPEMLATSTEALADLGFRSAGSRRRGITGSPTLPSAGGTRALRRSETVAVTIPGRERSVRRPDLVGAVVGEAAALSSTGDPGLGRHRRDFVILAGLLSTRDVRNDELMRKDRRRLRAMVGAVEKDRTLVLEVPDAEDSLDRLVTAGGS